MPKLSISAEQKTLLDNLDGYLHDAFSEGVEAPGHPSVLPEMERYSELESGPQSQVRDTFRQVAAALWKAGGSGGGGDIIAGQGLTRTDKTLSVRLSSVSGLEFSGGALQIRADSTLTRGAGGLAVAGLPALFRIAGTAVSSNVTANNLSALTGGGVTTLHSHSHGDQAGGSLHALATTSSAGFMSGADKAKLDGLSLEDYVQKSGDTMSGDLEFTSGTVLIDGAEVWHPGNFSPSSKADASALNAHASASSDAHVADAISYSPAPGMYSVDVQSAIDELKAEIDSGGGGGGAPIYAHYEGNAGAELLQPWDHTPISFDGTRFATDQYVHPNWLPWQLVLPVSGVYQINVQVPVEAPDIATEAYLALMNESGEVLKVIAPQYGVPSRFDIDGTYHVSFGGSVLIDLLAHHHYHFAIYQDSGYEWQVLSGLPQQTWLTINKVANL